MKAKARSPPSDNTHLSIKERLRDFLRGVALLSLRLAQDCDKCKTPCDKGTFIVLTRVEGGHVNELSIICSCDCFLDHVEEDLIDSRVDQAVRDERTFLHNKICPACKLRVRSGIETGEFNDVPQ